MYLRATGGREKTIDGEEKAHPERAEKLKDERRRRPPFLSFLSFPPPFSSSPSVGNHFLPHPSPPFFFPLIEKRCPSFRPSILLSPGQKEKGLGSFGKGEEEEERESGKGEKERVLLR